MGFDGLLSKTILFCTWVMMVTFWQGGLNAQDNRPQVAPKLRDLNSYFPFSPPHTLEHWESRKKELRHHLQVALGLWPYPKIRAELEPTIHGLMDQGDYTIEKVFFDGGHGLFVTGNLYKPKNINGKIPGILTPHGHFPLGRFGGQSEEEIQRDIDSGGETYRSNSKSKLQTRCANLAKMGCVVFLYDMIGYADSRQISFEIAHRFAKQRPNMSTPTAWGLFSPQAESNLQNVMGLQAWNSIRALDFLESLPEVDSKRIGVTGASGGGTQTFILCALDDRPAAAFPAVMVSTAMQGGCTCENCCYLRIGTGNVEFAAMFAPKPLGLTAANDWTIEMETKGFPELQSLYELYGKKENVQLNARLEFGHNYNQVSREAMYRWFKTHLGFEGEPVETQVEYIDPKRLSVFDDAHPQPMGGAEFEQRLLNTLAQHDQAALLENLSDPSQADFDKWIGGFVDVVYNATLASAGENVLIKKEEILSGFMSLPEKQFLFTNPNSADVSRLRTVLGAKPCHVLFISHDGNSIMEDQSEISLLATTFVEQGFGIRVFENNSVPMEAKEQTRRVENPRESLSYTLGYNAPQIAKRAHAWHFPDLEEVANSRHFIVSLDRAAPEVALNAKRLSNASQLAGIVIDTDGFRFQEITDLRDPDLLPGAAKYFDLPGLLSLAAPKPMLLIGEDSNSAAFVIRAYQAAGKPENLTLVKTIPVGTTRNELILNWIKANSKE